MNVRLKHALLRLDDGLQAVVPLKTPVYTADQNVLDGAGVYTAAEWSRTRRIGAAGDALHASAYDSDEQYRRYVMQVAGSKVASVTALMDAFDFGRFSKIFEVGCGDMSQALHITKRWPDVEYVATDFDPYVIERCATLPVLSGIRKQVFDVLADSHEAFAGFDLLVSFGLDAALDDGQFGALLASVRRLQVPYLMCSPTTIGPIVQLYQWSSRRARQRMLDERRIRMHGWARSVSYFSKLASAAGVPMRSVGRHGLYSCLLFGAAPRSVK